MRSPLRNSYQDEDRADDHDADLDLDLDPHGPPSGSEPLPLPQSLPLPASTSKPTRTSQSSLSPPPPAPTSTPASAFDPQSSTTMPASSLVKRVVRFASSSNADADSDGEDGLPLHLVRQKKKREQKAAFLKEEQARRQREEQARRQADRRVVGRDAGRWKGSVAADEEVWDERRQQVEDRRRAEEERRRRMIMEEEASRRVEQEQRERERKEREQKEYKDVVARTRERRDMQRAGGVPSLTGSSASLNQDAYGGGRNNLNFKLPPPALPTHPAAPADGRRLSTTSIPQLPQLQARDSSASLALSLSLPPQLFPSDSSPDSSRAPSVGGQSPSVPFLSPTGAAGPQSRPGSTYSSSSEDMQMQMRQQGGGGSRAGSVRGSMVGGMGGGLGMGGMGMGMGMPATPLNPYPLATTSPMIMTYPTWSGSNPNLQHTPPIIGAPLLSGGGMDYMQAHAYNLGLAHAQAYGQGYGAGMGMGQDMPLLPPTAPFMKHSSYERRSSSRSRGSSPGSSPSPNHSLNGGSRRGSFTSLEREKDKVDVYAERPPMRSQSASAMPKVEGNRVSKYLLASHGQSIGGGTRKSSDPSPMQKPSGLSQGHGHSRKGSGDSKDTSFSQHTSRTQHSSYTTLSSLTRPTPPTSRSQPVLSRGRPPPSSAAQAQFVQSQGQPQAKSYPPVPPMPVGYNNNVAPSLYGQGHGSVDLRSQGSRTSLRSSSNPRARSQGRMQTLMS